VARSSRRSRLRWLAACALTLATLGVLALVLLSSGSGSGGHPGLDAGVPTGDTAAGVTRRTLSETSTVSGTLGYGSTLELYDRLGGTFTWLPSVGAVIGRGGTLWRINDAPVVLMFGAVPAYRTLKQGVGDGPDVSELNQNLIDLGYDPYGAITDDESFGEATAAAVRRWQRAEGLSQSGQVELGRVVFAPSARRVTNVKVTLGQDPPGAPATAATGTTTPAATTPAATEPGPDEPPTKKPAGKSPVKNSTDNGRDTPAKDQRAKAKSTGKKPPEEKSAEKEPAKEAGDKDPPAGESATSAGEVALTTTSTQQIVQLKVKPEQQQLARLGETVTVQLPGDVHAPGKVTEVGTVASESSAAGDEAKGSPSGESDESTIPVTVTLERHVAHLDEAPVSVELVKAIRHSVLTVPVTALIATAGGGYAVEALLIDRRVTVPVTPGMFASGYVQVEGAGVREGMTVIESQ
jgi:peptidoglycan hydrolase-like protein with peptidoglycan-binding domain